MKFVLALMFFAPVVSAAPVDVCFPRDGVKYFVSQWSEDGSSVTTLSRVDGLKFSVQEGRVAYSEDLNGDGVKDSIFVSYDSAGSSKDLAYSFLVHCRGFLRSVGGDYFADVKVLDSSSGGSSFKDIQIFSYDRDGRGNVKYKGDEALTTPHLWRFNPETKQYEGESK